MTDDAQVIATGTVPITVCRRAAPTHAEVCLGDADEFIVNLKADGPVGPGRWRVIVILRREEEARR